MDRYIHVDTDELEIRNPVCRLKVNPAMWRQVARGLALVTAERQLQNVFGPVAFQLVSHQPKNWGLACEDGVAFQTSALAIPSAGQD